MLEGIPSLTTHFRWPRRVGRDEICPEKYTWGSVPTSFLCVECVDRVLKFIPSGQKSRKHVEDPCFKAFTKFAVLAFGNHPRKKIKVWFPIISWAGYPGNIGIIKSPTFWNRVVNRPVYLRHPVTPKLRFAIIWTPKTYQSNTKPEEIWLDVQG